MKVRKAKLLGILALALVLPFALPVTSSAQDVKLLGVVAVPGSPILSSDITWGDPGTERVYLTDRSNFGVDILDGENHFFVGRVGGMVGPAPGPADGTHAHNGPGPNGVVVTGDKVLWAGDGDSLTTVADVDPSSPTYLQILPGGHIDTSNPECDNGVAHWCGRDDEIAWDPKDRVIMIANNGPSDVNAPHGPVAPYVTLISGDFPYSIIAPQILFPGTTGIEQPLWDPDLRGGRFLLTVPGSLANHIPPFIAIIDPADGFVDETIYLDCHELLGTTSQSITGIALGHDQHILVSACGAGPVPSAPIIVNAVTLEVHAVVTQVGGGDQVWYNSGDNRFYVTGTDLTGTTGLQSLGVIDGATSTWLQNVTDVRGKNPTAFAENNHVFTLVQINQAIVDGTMPDDSVCAQFGITRTGCIAVFGPDDIEP
jgi:hypothetical protein